MYGLKNWRGLKFPDIYIVRFFFKFVKKYHLASKRVLELGCGSGNNLYLFNIYGFEVQGVDISKQHIQNAKYNFKEILKAPAESYNFVEADIRSPSFLEKIRKNNDVLLLPNIVYYLSRVEFINTLENLQGVLASKGLFFIRFRTPRDGRNLCLEFNGSKAILKTDKTGELHTTQTFYDEYEMVDILRRYLNISNFKIFHVYEEVEAKIGKVFNSDIVIWGEFYLHK